MKMLCLITLTNGTSVDVITDHLAILRDVEISAEAVEGLLDTLMAGVMGSS
jgi:hypothetical protein